MATKIKFSFGDKDYCLEYTKASVKRMEDRGFSPSRILEAPVTYLPELFAGAFYANHPYISRKIVEDIFEQMRGRKELVSTLLQMYNEPVNALTDEADEGNGIEWTKE